MSAEMAQTKTVHLDKIEETLANSDNVAEFGWDNGTLNVWIQRGMLHSDTLDELRTWGVEIEYIQFTNNHIAFSRRQ